MNKKISITTTFLSLVVFMGLLFSSCSKNDPTLGPLPTANFKWNILTPSNYTAPQNIQLINTSSDAGIAYWDIPGVGKFQGDTVLATTVFAGDYPVTLTIASQGGIGTNSQTVNVTNDNPFAVDPTGILGVLTGAGLGETSRTWKANRVLMACIVDPDFTSALNHIDAGGGGWWGFGPAEIAPGTGREGYLDDSYHFTFGKNGSFIFDDNQTVYLDQGGSGWTKALPAPWNTYGGTTSSTDLYNLVPALKPWGSGTFTYTVAPAPAGYKKLGQFTVNGVGAHMGLQDKVNGDQVVVPTEIKFITYDVLRITTNKVDDSGVHYDEIITGVAFNGGVWAFRFRSDR